MRFLGLHDEAQVNHYRNAQKSYLANHSATRTEPSVGVSGVLAGSILREWIFESRKILKSEMTRRWDRPVLLCVIFALWHNGFLGRECGF
jgi:hypothetical protein